MWEVIIEQYAYFIVIDLQGFVINNKIYAKEVLVSIRHFEKQTFQIKSTTKYSELSKNDRVTNNWLYNHLHGLRWNSGESTMKDLREYLMMVKRTTWKRYTNIYN